MYRENSWYSSCVLYGWGVRFKIHTINKERRKRKKSFLHVCCWSECAWELRMLLGEDLAPLLSRKINK